jgi:heat-inducible transcriptional repressor
MRVLKPEAAKEREEKLLRWIIQEFVHTKRPIGSELVATKARLGVSSATIRSAMKKLEDEGFLHQEHTSGGRVPTDKAYRFYVDYITGMQALALKEKDSIQREYDRQMDEMDGLLVQTSKMLSALSHSAGFAYASSVCDQNIMRLDFVPLGPTALLAILITDSGNIRHFPVRLNYEIPPRRLRLLGAFVSSEVEGLPLREARKKLWHYLNEDHSELRDVADITRQFLDEIEKHSACENALYIEGMGKLFEQAEGSSSLHDMLYMMEERRRLAELLNEKLRELTSDSSGNRLRVSIGSENALREMRDLSMVSCSYRTGERTVGMLGIIGPKHMEYSRMISLVNFMGEVVEKTISHWEKMVTPEHRIIPLEFDAGEIKNLPGPDDIRKPPKGKGKK